MTASSRTETEKQEGGLCSCAGLVSSAMDDNCFRREYGAANPRRMSAAPELGCYSSPQDGEALEVFCVSEAAPGTAGRRTKRRDSATQGSHQRHMPIEPLKLPIPRKTKEKIGKLSGKNKG